MCDGDERGKEEDRTPKRGRRRGIEPWGSLGIIKEWPTRLVPAATLRTFPLREWRGIHLKRQMGNSETTPSL